MRPRISSRSACEPCGRATCSSFGSSTGWAPEPRPPGQHRAGPVGPRRGLAGARRPGRADRHHDRCWPPRVRHLRGAGRVRRGGRRRSRCPPPARASRCRSSDWEPSVLRDAGVADQHVSQRVVWDMRRGRLPGERAGRRVSSETGSAQEAPRAQSNEDLVRRFVEACRRTRTILPGAGRRGAPDRSAHRRAGPARAVARPRAPARRAGRRRRDAVRLAQAVLAVCAVEWEMFLADRGGGETAAVRGALRAFAELGRALIGARDTGEALDAVIADSPGWEGSRTTARVRSSAAMSQSACRSDVPFGPASAAAFPLPVAAAAMCFARRSAPAPRRASSPGPTAARRRTRTGRRPSARR